jgi:Transposase.
VVLGINAIFFFRNTKVSFLFSETIPFTKFTSFSHKFSFVISTLLPPLRLALYAGRVKLFADAKEPYPHAVFHFVAFRKAALFRRPKRWHAKGDRDCRNDERRAVKVVATVLWDSGGVLLVEFLKTGATLSSERYVQTRRKLKQRIRRIEPNRKTNKIIIRPLVPI